MANLNRSRKRKLPSRLRTEGRRSRHERRMQQQADDRASATDISALEELADKKSASFWGDTP